MGIRSFFPSRFSACRKPGVWFARRVACKLKLDGNQKNALESVRSAFETLRNDAKRDIAQQREALVSLLSGDRIDREAALRLAKAPVTVVNETLPSVVERLADFFEALSVDQRNQVRNMVSQRCGRRRCCST